MVKSIKTHKSTEGRTYPTTDKIMKGLLNLCENIIKVAPNLKEKVGDPKNENLVLEIFGKCLFDINPYDEIQKLKDIKSYDKNVVKCKSEESRVAAYNILQTLCDYSPSNL